MKYGRYAITKNGEITWCSSLPENFGKGRCDHIDHQKQDETVTDFINRVNIKKHPESKERIINSHANYESFDWLDMCYHEQCEKAMDNFRTYYDHVKNMEWQISYMTTFELPTLDNESRKDYFNKIYNLEVERVKKHDRCLESVAILNNLCTKLEIPPFISGNCTSGNRDNVAQALFDFCKVKQVEIKFI
jgi:hypothetical protein